MAAFKLIARSSHVGSDYRRGVHTSMLLEMAADGYGDRVAIGSKPGGITYADLLDKARRAAVWASSKNVTRVGLVDVNTEAVPILLYGAGLAGMQDRHRFGVDV